MSLGRKKKETKVKIEAPALITRTTYTNPLGDQFTSSVSKGVEQHSSILSDGTRALVNESMSGLQALARELNAPDERRMRQIGERSQDYYDLQAQGINQDVDDALARTRSDLNKRFGGAYNATFGTDLLASIEGSRLGRLADARKEAALLGEDLFRQDEASRIQRFTLFQNYLNDLNNQARGLQSSNTSILSSERQRDSDLAIARANLAMKYAAEDRQYQAEQAQKNREAAARIALQVAKLMA
jgi:hypothetical protein